ncbi:MAG TPA: ABC transporter ATP-binding protein [Herpetosiphonaceae bacterium]
MFGSLWRAKTTGANPSPVMPAAAPLLRISDLAKTYGSGRGAATVLRDVSLTVRAGEFVSLLGHSGCGKSTLLNIIAGLARASAGAIDFAGRPLAGPGHERAVVFQHYSLLPWLSVFQNVYQAVEAARPALDRSGREALAREALERVGLAAHLEKRPAQLSGGMRQRVAIARAFAVQPRMLLLDEPFGALDALTRAALQEELLGLWQGESRTESVVMVTHDIDEAIYLSDRIAVFSDGPAATIRQVLEVDLPRPRDKAALLRAPRWQELRDELLGLLGGSAGAGAPQG